MKVYVRVKDHDTTDGGNDDINVDKGISSCQEFVKTYDLTVNEIRSAFGFIPPLPNPLDDPKPEADAQTK